MLRLDAEITSDLDGADEQLLIRAVQEYIEKEKPQVLIFEDYNKGVLTERVIRSIIEICNKGNIILTNLRHNCITFRKRLMNGGIIIDLNLGNHLCCSKQI